MVIPKIKTATNLRTNLYETLKEVSEGDDQVVTHKQGEPVLLTSKLKYDQLLDEIEALKKMAIGLSQVHEGKGLSHKDAVKKLEKLKNKWK